MPSASHTWGRRNAPSSRRMPASRGAGCRGTRAATLTSAAAPTRPTMTKVHRQPTCCPSRVPSGTPTTFARVSPANIMETAFARCSRATRLAATTAPTPKNVPWGSPARTRVASRVSWLGASADTRFDAVNNAIVPSSIVFLGRRAPTAVSAGAPITTPRA